VKLKEFFKPDWRKIVIFIILSSIFSFYTYNRLYQEVEWFCARVGYPGCPSLMSMTLENFVWYFPLILIISYLLSCLIVWIYDKKFRKVKKR